MGPSFRWAALLLPVLFDTVEVLLFDQLCYLRQPSYPCSPRYRVGDNQISIRIIKSTMIIAYRRWCCLPSIRFFYSDCFGRQVLHRDAVMSYGCCVSLSLVRQSRVPVVEFVLWGVSKLACHLLDDLRDLLLIDCAAQTLWSYLCRWALDALLFSLLCGAPAQSITGSNTSLCTFLCCWFFFLSNSAALSLSIVSLSHRSIWLINVMLVGHLTLISYIN